MQLVTFLNFQANVNISKSVIYIKKILMFVITTLDHIAEGGEYMHIKLNREKQQIVNDVECLKQDQVLFLILKERAV